MAKKKARAACTAIDDERFGLEMQRLTRRIEKLSAWRDGSATATTITVRRYRVRAHEVGAHTRIYIRARKAK